MLGVDRFVLIYHFSIVSEGDVLEIGFLFGGCHYRCCLCARDRVDKRKSSVA